MLNRIFAVGLAATFAMPATATTITERFSSYYAFGDSLTDDGKFGQLFPPSLGGRFSNGRTYAEYIADVFEAENLDTGNLALGGATGGNINTRPLGPLATFTGQIGTFAAALSGAINLPTAADFSASEADATDPGSNPLVSVLFGGNDVFQGADLELAADTVANGIRAIASLSGGLFNDFFVMDLPDVGGAPAYAFGGAEAATADTNTFNAQLALNLIDLRTEGLNIYGFDSSRIFDDILADIENGGTQFGILDGTSACTANLAEQGPSCLDLGIDPNTLAFADGVHPSGSVHEVLGNAAIARIAAIPLPAAAPLIMFAVASMGWVGRRRRAA